LLYLEQLLCCRRSARAKRLSLRINAQNRFILTIPHAVSYSKALDWAKSQAPWIQAQLSQLPELISLSQYVERHPFLSYSGMRLPLIIQDGSGCAKAKNYQISLDGIYVWLDPGKDERWRNQSLYQLVRILAKQFLTERVDHWVAAYSLQYHQVRIGDQQTRWGSCSNRKTISLNWRLLLIRPQLQDAVILHELAHLTEMNHSASFWRLRARYDPNYAAHHRELKRLSREILSVGRSI
jgi:predicted metal-dependent hydrolase